MYRENPVLFHSLRRPTPKPILCAVPFPSAVHAPDRAVGLLPRGTLDDSEGGHELYIPDLYFRLWIHRHRFEAVDIDGATNRNYSDYEPVK